MKFTSFRLALLAAFTLLTVVGSREAAAQQAGGGFAPEREIPSRLISTPTAPLANAPANVAQAPARRAPSGGFRQLAEGVLREVDPAQQYIEGVSRHDVVELLDVDPNFNWARDVDFRHDIWGLEFAYKPIRFIEVDVPQPSGRMARKSVWYMVYRVKNPTDKEIRFVPTFILETDVGKRYLDRIVPVALEPIRQREDARRQFANSVDVTSVLAPGEERWGVAMWHDVDPRADFISVFAQGLTNAYRWEDTAAGRKFSYKTLRLNFWRPGDDQHEHEDEIRIGAPDQVDYEWIYR